MPGIALRFKTAALVVCLLVPPTPAFSAGIPVIDGVSITLGLRKMVTDLKSWARNEALSKAGIETDIEIADDRQASDENVAANTIVRITDAIEATHNQAMDAQVTPSFMACSSVSTARAIKSSEAAAKAGSSKAMFEYWTSELSPPGTSRAGYTNQVDKRISSKMAEINAQLQGTGKEEAFTRADAFLRLGTFNDLAYSDAEEESAKLFIELLIGPYSDRSKLLIGDKTLDELTPKERLELARSVVRKGAVRAVLENIRKDFIADSEGNSIAKAREYFINTERFSNDQWHKRMTCTGNAGGPANCATDSIILKDLAIMNGQSLALLNDILRQEQSKNLLLSILVQDNGET